MAFSSEEAMAEFGQLFNFEQAAASSQAHQGKTVVAPQFAAPGPDHAFIPSQSQQTFQPPSHKYELYSQHTSLAPGAYSVQQNKHIPSHSYNIGASNAPVLDMLEVDGGSYSGMDMDFPDMFDTNSMTGFVDPSSVGSDAGDVSPVTRPVQRLWPGMHQQHAAAKEQQKKYQQQKLMERQRSHSAQQQLNTQSQLDHQRRGSQPRKKPSDPLVEERISQILRTMRQSQNQATQSTTPQPSSTQSAKQKKEEDDMDEDERLLASEEGKKLSSKERRQLRNKVSARAFRSRRKEYISQLEGELQGKQSEADDLRCDNDALRAENAQLTDLARMLLGHPAFNGVLEDLSARGATMPTVPSQSSQQRSQRPQESRPTVQPPSNADFSTPMDGWSNDIGAPEFNFNPSVFAVTELPEPILQAPLISEKALEAPYPAYSPTEPIKLDYPCLASSTPKRDFPTSTSYTDSDSDDIFADVHVATGQTAHVDMARVASLAAGLSDKRDTCSFELVSLEDMEVQEQIFEKRFDTLCKQLDNMCVRIENATSRS